MQPDTASLAASPDCWFDIIQSVEDVLPDGSGLIRYKVDKDSVYQTFGQLNLLRYSTRFLCLQIMDLCKSIDECSLR